MAGAAELGGRILTAVELAHKILGAGRPLVVLHGLFGTLDNWQTVGRRLAERRQVVLVDLPNHGRSPHVEAVDYADQAVALAGFLADQWMHEVDVLGHSMGAKVAMRLALDYPDRVRSLVAVDMAPRAYAPGHGEIFAAMRSVPVGDDLTRGEIDALLAERIAEPGVRRFLMKNLARRREGGFRWKVNLEALHRGYERLLAPVTGGPWGGPALFVRGAASDYVRDVDLAGIRERFPAARLVTIAGAGHWVHADRPAELLEAVEAFLPPG